MADLTVIIPFPGNAPCSLLMQPEEGALVFILWGKPRRRGAAKGLMVTPCPVAELGGGLRPASPRSLIPKRPALCQPPVPLVANRWLI